MMDKSNLLQDDFSCSKTPQQWIGISYMVSEEEGWRCLDMAVEEEWKLGDHQYMDARTQAYFMNPVADLLKLDTLSLKAWFVQVFQGWLKLQKNILKDEFYYDGAMKEWAGL